MSKTFFRVAAVALSIYGRLVAQPVPSPEIQTPGALNGAASNGVIAVGALNCEGTNYGSIQLHLPFVRSSKVAVSFSADEGISWTSPKTISPSDEYANDIEVAAAAAGRFYFVWSSGDILSGMRLHTAVTNDNGMTFTSSTRLQSYLDVGQGFLNPKISVAGQNLLVAWVAAKQDASLKPLAYYLSCQSTDLSQSGPITETASIFGSPSSVFAEQNVASSNHSSVLVGALTNPDDISPAVKNTIFWTRSTDSVATWSNPKPVTTHTIYGSRPQVASDGNESWLVAYFGRTDAYSNSPANLYVQRSEDDGLTWSEPHLVSVLNFTERDSCCMAGDGNGRWILVTESNYYTFSEDNGRSWSNLIPLWSSHFGSTKGDISCNGNGKWLLFKDHKLVVFNWSRAGVGEWSLY